MYDDLPIVDAHHHLWDLEGQLRYPWLTSGEHSYMGDYSSLRRSYLPDEYRRDTALHNVVATVHIEAECDRSQQVAETRWLTEIAARHGMPNAIVAHAWIDTPNAEEIIAPAQAISARARHPHQAGHLGRARQKRARAAAQHAGPQVAQRPVAAGEARPVLGPAGGVVAPGGGGRGGARAPGPAHRAQPHGLSARPLARGAERLAPRHGGARRLPQRVRARSRAWSSRASRGRSPPTSRSSSTPSASSGSSAACSPRTSPSTASRAAGTTSTASSSGRWRTSPLADRRKLFAENAARFYRIDARQARGIAVDCPSGRPSSSRRERRGGGANT